MSEVFVLPPVVTRDGFVEIHMALPHKHGGEYVMGFSLPSRMGIAEARNILERALRDLDSTVESMRKAGR